jgi:hypothetical protein
MNTYKKSGSRSIIILAILLALVGLFAAAPARAADTRSGDQVVIGRGEVIEDDLYVAANSVTIDGTINGDLVAVGSQITINGTVKGDLLAAAQGIAINGTVNDDVRAAGQAIMLGPSARVAGDLAMQGRQRGAGRSAGWRIPGAAGRPDRPECLGRYEPRRAARLSRRQPRHRGRRRR